MAEGNGSGFLTYFTSFSTCISAGRRQGWTSNVNILVSATCHTLSSPTVLSNPHFIRPVSLLN